LQSFTLAVIQNRPGFDKEKNVREALSMIVRARTKGADVVCLPEIFVYPYELSQLRKIAEDDGATHARLQEKARELGLYICTGSIPEKEGDVVFNRAYLIGPDGGILLSYSKSHLFDVRLPNLQSVESDVFTPGDQLAVAETPLAVFGILICYDIRFPEMARKLRLMGTEVLLVPAAFNTITGPAHWHILFRARAIENQFFTAAASPALTKKSAYRAYGHSLIISPWGNVLAEATSGPAIITARLTDEVLQETRTRLPLLRQRRPELY
jgi:predicted amidohydrolase